MMMTEPTTGTGTVTGTAAVATASTASVLSDTTSSTFCGGGVSGQNDASAIGPVPNNKSSSPSPSLLGSLSALLSSSRTGNGSNSANNEQAIYLQAALADLMSEKDSSSISITIPSLSTRTTASSAQQQQNLAALSPQEAMALKLSIPLTAERDSIPTLPGHVRDNVAATLGSLIDSRLKSSLSLLARQTMKLGSIEEAKMLAKLCKAPGGFASDIAAVVMAFRLVLSPPTTSAASSTADTTGNNISKTTTLPLIFEVVADVNILNKMDTLMMTANGSISGTFSSDSSSSTPTATPTGNDKLEQVVITIDTISLLTAMITQARKVSKSAVRRAAKLAAKAQEEKERKARAAAARLQQEQQEQQIAALEAYTVQRLAREQQQQMQQQQQQRNQMSQFDLGILSALSGQGSEGSMASIADLLNNAHARSEQQLGSLLLGGEMQKSKIPQAFFSSRNADVAFSPIPIIREQVSHPGQHHHQMQMQQQQPLLSEEELRATRKMIDSTEGLPAGLAQVTTELRVETEEALRKRKKRRRSSATYASDDENDCNNNVNSNGNGSTSYQQFDEDSAQPMTLSSLFAQHDKMMEEEEERNRKTTVEALVGSTSGGKAFLQQQQPQDSTINAIAKQQQEPGQQLFSWLPGSGMLLGQQQQQHPLLQQHKPSAASATAASVTQVLQASAPSMLSLLSGGSGGINNALGVPNAFAGGNVGLSCNISSLSTSSLLGKKRKSRTGVGCCCLNKKVSFNMMVNETFEDVNGPTGSIKN